MVVDVTAGREVAFIGDVGPEGISPHLRRRGRPPVRIDVARLLELRAAGRSLRNIAQELGVGRTTVGRLLGNLSQNSSGPSQNSAEEERA